MKKTCFNLLLPILISFIFLSNSEVGAVPYLDPIAEGAPSLTTTLSGNGGTAGLTVWYWQNSGYDYFAYQLLNNGGYNFSDYIAYLSIGYPVTKEYTVTGSAGSSKGGTSWTPSTWSTSPANVSWSAVGDAAPIFPVDTSTTNPYFEFALLHTSDVLYGLVSADIMDTGKSGHGYTIGPVPELGTMLLLGSLAVGLFGTAGIKRRFRI